MAASPVVAVAAQPTAPATGSGRPTFVDDEILVKFRPGTPAAEQARAHSSVLGQVVRDVPGLDVTVIRVGQGQAQQRLGSYLRNPNVEFAELNGIAYPTWTPNDTLYDGANDQQWALNNTGKTGGKADADIDAPQAWNVTLGTPSTKTPTGGTTIAVVDTGLLVSHPDLAAKITDSRDWYDGTDVNDVYGHGTHVAGIAAAVTNNGTGVAGACPNCKLLNAKVCDNTGSCPYDRIANGVLWSVGCEWRDARDNCLSPIRARTINISIAGSTASSTLQSAINKAWSRGAVLTCAAGNAGTTSLYYPAAYSNCIAVAATDASDVKASWSNYGSSWVDVAAPGVNIWGTLNPGAATFSDPSGYGRLSGTSMASPQVAGVAGLVWARGVQTTNTAVRKQIESSVDRIPGTGSAWVYGRLNACRAVGATGC
jgi:thermitase